MVAAAALWLLASPFLVGGAIGAWPRVNRFIARHYGPALVAGWIGVGLLLAAVLVFDGAHAKTAGLAGAPLAGLSFWSRRDGGDDGDDGDDPDRGPEPDGGIDWNEFARELEDHVAARERPRAALELHR